MRAFGATIAALHLVSRGRHIAGAPIWNLERIARCFEDPRLEALLSEHAAEVAREALSRFGPRFEAYLTSRRWTGLIHSDSHRHNVVLHEGRGGLIDFGEAGFGPLFWDLGVAVADSVADAPELSAASRRALVQGYLSVLPEAAEPIERDLAVFEAMQSLEVMTWPVSDWTPERLAEGEEEARENIAVSVLHLESLL